MLVYDVSHGLRDEEEYKKAHGKKGPWILWRGETIEDFDVSGKKLKVITGWGFPDYSGDIHNDLINTFDLVNLETGNCMGFRFKSKAEAKKYIVDNCIDGILSGKKTWGFTTIFSKE